MKKPNFTPQAIKFATSRLAGDITSLSAQKEDALSTFRRTAVQLENINNDLRIKMNDLSDLTMFIEEQKCMAAKMMEDNEKVRNRIIDIIGE